MRLPSYVSSFEVGRFRSTLAGRKKDLTKRPTMVYGSLHDRDLATQGVPRDANARDDQLVARTRTHVSKPFQMMVLQSNKHFL